ncbi:hypothetical protein JCM8097_003303 [Rhodosporidiobolus ruineniae]
MPKLKKPQHGTPSASTHRRTPSDASASSTHRPPSILSSSTLSTSPVAPIRIRSTAQQGTISQARLSGVEAWGDLDGEWDSEQVGRSRSPTRSSEASSVSPSRSFQQRQPLAPLPPQGGPSNTQQRAESAFSLKSTASTSSHAVPPTSSTSEGGSSALAQLRKRLDSDETAREAARVREASTPSVAPTGGEGGGAGKLRKKMPRGVAEKLVEGKKAKEENEGGKNGTDGDGVDGATQRAMDEIERELGGEAEEGEQLDPTQLFTRWGLPPSLASSAYPPLPYPPIAPPSFPPSVSTLSADSSAGHALFRSPTSVLLAPVQVGWTLTTLTIDHGLRLSLSVLRYVPVAGRFVPQVPPPPPPPTPASFETESTEESQGGFLSLPFARPGFIRSSSPSPSSRSSAAAPKPPSSAPAPSASSATLLHAAELALSASFAGVLVSLAVGEMVADGVVDWGRKVGGLVGFRGGRRREEKGKGKEVDW